MAEGGSRGISPEDVLQMLKVADARIGAAIEASDFPPPDFGFPDRLRDLAEAIEGQVGALRGAEGIGSVWVPRPFARKELSHETRPRATRPGDPDLWMTFDERFDAVVRAYEGPSITAVIRAYSQLSAVLYELEAEMRGYYAQKLDELSSRRRGRRSA